MHVPGGGGPAPRRPLFRGARSPTPVASSRRLSAIVFTDMAGSTELAQRDERTALALIEEQETLARPIVRDHRGRLVKSTGDGLLMEFPSALDAIECAVEFQRQVHARNQTPGRVPLVVRVGAHLGDVQARNDDIFGDAVNVTARVESVAAPGGICVSESLYNQIRNKVSYPLEPLGDQTLKGVREPMAIYRVVLPWSTAVGSAPAPPSGNRIAVLPLANISPDPNDEYFADGLTEELIAVLSKIPMIRVIARTSVNPYKSRTKSIAQIGTELGVRSVLEGSVRKAGDRLRITLQLVDVTTQEPVWAERYDRQLSDVFAIQTEIAESTARSIRVELSGAARKYLRRPPTTNLAAYDLYLRASRLFDTVDPDIYRESVALLETAIEKDPQFAQAYAQLGDRLVQGAGDYFPHREGFIRARACVMRALELDPAISEAHSALANLIMQEEHDWGRAEEEFRRALALNPSNGNARMHYAGLLRTLGRTEEAEGQARAAIETDPSWWVPRWMLVELPLIRGDLVIARERADQLPQPNPFPEFTHLSLGMAYARRGDRDAARRELVAAGPSPLLMARLAHATVLAMLGEPDEARALLSQYTGAQRAGFVSSDFVAALYAAIGEKEHALSVLEKAASDGESGLWLRYMIPAFDTIRTDPRFVALIRAYHFPEAVTRAATGAPPGI